jgi:hypothetical protein
VHRPGSFQILARAKAGACHAILKVAKRLGLRWQSGNGDTAFARTTRERTLQAYRPHERRVSRLQSGFPPYSGFLQLRRDFQRTGYLPFAICHSPARRFHASRCIKQNKTGSMIKRSFHKGRTLQKTNETKDNDNKIKQH